MKKIMTFLGAVLFMLVSFSGLQAQSEKAMEPYPDIDMEPIREIVVNGGFRVFISQGAEYKLKIDAEPDVLPMVVSEVKKNVLTIGFEKKKAKNKAGKIAVYITVTELTKITAAGACVLEGQTAFNLKELTVKLDGATLRSMNMTGKKLSLHLNGASKAELTAQVSSLDGVLKGSSSATVTTVSGSKVDMTLNASSSLSLSGKADTYDLLATGNSTIDASVTADRINIEANDSSVTLTGSASSEKIKATGASSIKAMGCVVTNAVVSLSKASTATIHSRKTLEADMTGGSKITYMDQGTKKNLDSEGKFKIKL